MSKRSVIVLKIGFLSFLAIVLLGFMLLVMSNKWSFRKLGKYFGDTSKYKLVLSESYNLSDISNVKFDLSSADADIRYHDSEDILLEIFDIDKSKVDVSSSNGILDVNFNKANSFCFGFCFGYRKAILYLPKNYNGEINVVSASGDVDVDNFNVKMNIVTASGDVKVLGADELKVETASGEVSVSNVNNLNIKTISGDIELDKINRLVGSTTSGDFDAHRLSNYIDFGSVSGDIEINSLSLIENSNIHTISGDVEINGINKVYINTSTTSGDVKVGTSDRTSSIELKIKTTSGDIEVN